MFEINSETGEIRIVNKSIATFLSENNDPKILESCERLLESYCESLKSTKTSQKPLTLTSTTINKKGAIGETTLADALGARLLNRDGFIVELVNNLAYNCDILVKRETYPSIRVESKAYVGRVNYNEVIKFERDLLALNNHGVFVSLHSQISNVSNFEIRQLENGKFAVYLSKNNYDTDSIVNMLYVIYKLDALCCTATTDVGINVSKENMSKLRSLLCDYSQKLNIVKANLKDNITIISNIQLDIIEKLILNTVPQEKDKQNCETCGKTFTKRGILQHQKKCQVII